MGKKKTPPSRRRRSPRKSGDEEGDGRRGGRVAGDSSPPGRFRDGAPLHASSDSWREVVVSRPVRAPPPSTGITDSGYVLRKYRKTFRSGADSLSSANVPNIGPQSPEEQRQHHLFLHSHACYYGGGLAAIVQSFLAGPMIYFGVEYLYDCPGGPFIPMILLTGGVLHLFWSLPFSGLFFYAMIRVGVYNVARGKIGAVLSPVARSAANAFFSSWVGYLMDLASLFVFALVFTFSLYKATSLTAHEWVHLFVHDSEEEELCDRRLLHFATFCAVFYPVFMASLVCILCVACHRRDHCRQHYLFREESRSAAAAAGEAAKTENRQIKAGNHMKEKRSLL